MKDGYFFVPFPDAVHCVKRPHAVFDRRIANTLSGTLTVTFVAEQPVHVGSGFKSLCNENIIRRGMTVRGGPRVPGASMKGVLRSRYEAITKSCAGRAPKAGTVRSTSRRDITWASFTPAALSEPVFDKCKDLRTCAACSLFGRMSQRSRVTVLDFESDGTFVPEMMRAQFKPNLHHLGKAAPTIRNGETLFEVSKLHGRKFAAGEGPDQPSPQLQAVEAIAKGSLLRGSIRFMNVLPEELGGLIAALGWNPSSYLKIGAGKGQQFGRIKLTALTWDLRDAARVPIAVHDERLNEWREAFKKSADYWDKGERALVEIHQGGC